MKISKEHMESVERAVEIDLHGVKDIGENKRLIQFNRITGFNTFEEGRLIITDAPTEILQIAYSKIANVKKSNKR